VLWYGIALLGMFLAYVTAKGELPIYLGFLMPQGTATTPPGLQTLAAQGNSAASALTNVAGFGSLGNINGGNPMSAIDNVGNFGSLGGSIL
jgi:hypothetical protein